MPWMPEKFPEFGKIWPDIRPGEVNHLHLEPWTLEHLQQPHGVQHPRHGVEHQTHPPQLQAQCRAQDCIGDIIPGGGEVNGERVLVGDRQGQAGEMRHVELGCYGWDKGVEGRGAWEDGEHAEGELRAGDHVGGEGREGLRVPLVAVQPSSVQHILGQHIHFHNFSLI